MVAITPLLLFLLLFLRAGKPSTESGARERTKKPDGIASQPSQKPERGLTCLINLLNVVVVVVLAAVVLVAAAVAFVAVVIT